MRVKQLMGCIRLERNAARQYLEGHHSQCVEVGAVIDALAPPLLRGHILRSPHRHPGVGERRRFARQHLGDAEIGQDRIVAFIQQHILRLQVAVDDSPMMGILKRICDLVKQPGRCFHA